MEELMKQKCEKYHVSFDVLTDEEKELLRREIEYEQKGMTVCDSVLDNPDIGIRSI